MADPTNDPYVLKLVASNLISVVLTGAAAWLAFGGNQFVTEDDVRRMLATEAPYLQDRALFLDMRNDIEDISIRLRQLEIDVGRINTTN